MILYLWNRYMFLDKMLKLSDVITSLYCHFFLLIERCLRFFLKDSFPSLPFLPHPPSLHSLGVMSLPSFAAHGFAVMSAAVQYSLC